MGGPLAVKKMMSFEDDLQLSSIRSDVTRLMNILSDPSSEVASSALNNIKKYRPDFEKYGLASIYRDYIREAAKNTPHYDVKVGIIGELYRLDDFEGLAAIGKNPSAGMR